MSSALKMALSFFAILGIFSGKAIRAFAAGYQTQKNTTDLIEQIAKRPMIHDQVTFAALNIIGQQNQAITGFMLQSYDLLMKEFVYSNPKKDIFDSVHEISCKTEHVEIIRSLMDERSEQVVKSLAAWGTSVLANFDLKFESVSLEPDVTEDSSRSHDVIVVFRVIGSGDNALRFQAAAYRKLNDLVSEVNTESTRMLRPQVRWA